MGRARTREQSLARKPSTRLTSWGRSKALSNRLSIHWSFGSEILASEHHTRRMRQNRASAYGVRQLPPSGDFESAWQVPVAAVEHFAGQVGILQSASNHPFATLERPPATPPPPPPATSPPAPIPPAPEAGATLETGGAGPLSGDEQASKNGQKTQMRRAETDAGMHCTVTSHANP